MVLPPVKMFDASTPPSSAPSGYRAVAGYIGGDTPHIWTDAEWKRFGRLRKLPIWVRSNPSAVNAQADAFAALERLYQLRVPRGVTIALDLETAVDGGYVGTFHEVMPGPGSMSGSTGRPRPFSTTPRLTVTGSPTTPGEGHSCTRIKWSRPLSTKTGKIMIRPW